MEFRDLGPLNQLEKISDMKFIILEEHRKGGSEVWKNTFQDFQSAEQVIMEKIGENYIKYYERWGNSWCGAEVSYSIVETND